MLAGGGVAVRTSGAEGVSVSADGAIRASSGIASDGKGSTSVCGTVVPCAGLSEGIRMGPDAAASPS